MAGREAAELILRGRHQCGQAPARGVPQPLRNAHGQHRRDASSGLVKSRAQPPGSIGLYAAGGLVLCLDDNRHPDIAGHQDVRPERGGAAEHPGGFCQHGRPAPPRMPVAQRAGKLGIESRLRDSRDHEKTLASIWRAGRASERNRVSDAPASSCACFDAAMLWCNDVHNDRAVSRTPCSVACGQCRPPDHRARRWVAGGRMSVALVVAVLNQNPRLRELRGTKHSGSVKSTARPWGL